MAVLLTGCSQHYSEKQAMKFITKALESKYNEKFNITKIEKYSESGAVPTKIRYSYEAVSEDTGVTFEGFASYYKHNGEEPTVSDLYESTMYLDDVTTRLNEIETGADGWELDHITPYATSESFSTDDISASADLDDYMSDGSKIEITIRINITSDNVEGALPSIYEYLKTVSDINNMVLAKIYDTESKHCYIHINELSEFTYETLVNEVMAGLDR